MIKNFDEFVQIVNNFFPNSTILKKHSLTGGMSAEMQRVIIKDAGETIKSIIIRKPSLSAFKTKPSAAEIEYNLLNFLYQQGIPVPKTLWYQAPSENNDLPIIVLEFIDGNPEYPLNPEENFAHQLAQTLCKIHQIQPPPDLIQRLPCINQVLRPLFYKEEGSLNLIMQEDKIRDRLQNIFPLISSGTKNCLLHGDFWHGNILWQNQSLIAVIDWEDACFGNPLYDLAISRLDLCWISGWKTMRYFTEIYQGLHDLDYTSLPYWDLIAALRLIRLAENNLSEWAAFFRPYGRSDISVQSLLKNYIAFVNRAIKQLESYE